MLARSHQERENAISAQSASRDADSDEEADAECPVFDKFYAVDGNASIKVLTNFTGVEFRKLYSLLEDTILEKWNIGRGKKCQQKPMDVLLMALTVLKHGGTWDLLAKPFNITGPTFERMITRFLPIICSKLHELFVADVAETYTLDALKTEKKTFKNFKYAVEAVDVTFQQANRPSGNMQEGKRYFSGKHKLYGYKMELTVRSNGLASSYSKHYPGSVSDFNIFQERLQTHMERLKKSEEDEEYEDNFEGAEDWPKHWAILADKGYQGGAEISRMITPYKKPIRGELSAAQERFNKKLSSDRILVENYFGRMVSYWNIMSRKYTWSEDLYDTFASLCVSLTNCLVDLNPLRQGDGDWYVRYRNRLMNIGTTKQNKRKQTQANYRANRRRRLSTILNQNIPAAEAETQPPQNT